MSSLDLDAFGRLGHDDLTGGFGALHVFYWQVIHAHAAQSANVYCRAMFNQHGGTSDHLGVVGARICRVHNDGVRAGEVLQMEPHGVLRCPFDERVILGLVCAYANGIVAVENLGVHSLVADCPHNDLNQSILFITFYNIYITTNNACNT